MEMTDVTIIGAGVIGLSVAAQAAGLGREVIVLEKNHSWGQETSSRNSEVVHAGIYYKTGSIKAQACLEGRQLLYAVCPQAGIGVQKIGKLIVATEREEIAILEQIQKTAFANGVKLFMLDQEEVRKREPHIFALAALHSPETGIVDSHALMKYFLSRAQAQGADLICEAHVIAIQKRPDGIYVLQIDNQKDRVELASKIVVNCAGNNAAQIAQLCGINIQEAGYEQRYMKGSYFRLTDRYRGLMRQLVYPVPRQNSLGIHTVLDMAGGVRLGPDEEEVDVFDYAVSGEKRDGFFEEARKYLPFLRKEDLFPDTSGIRAQLIKPNSGDFKDFIIRHEADCGLPGLINLIGIESPGLTASPYIGKYVRRILEKL